MDSQGNIAPPSSHYTRSVGSEEQKIYDHFLKAVQSESAEEILNRIRTLLVEGSSYDDRDVLSCLDRLVLSDSAYQDFQFILNRCAHILTNRWQGRPHTQSAVPQLIQVIGAGQVAAILEHIGELLRFMKRDGDIVRGLGRGRGQRERATGGERQAGEEGEGGSFFHGRWIRL